MIALRDGQDPHPTRVKISPGGRGDQKAGFGENTSLRYGYTIVVTNSRQQQVTSSYSVTQRRRCYECKKNTADDCYESNPQKTQSSNTPGYWNVKPVFPTT
ncbi:hypothetical protein [Microcoleus sp. MON2_D5]|uniref:hypothetical protein n=1 Tax=Microcoleus sp. MON2_D5 TaxID=2818833 RepID=UPI002FD6BF94